MPNYYLQTSTDELEPTEAQLYATRKCNLNCGYCNLTKRRFEKELDTKELKKGINNLEKLGIKTIKFLGGEPTVRDDLEEIIRFVNKTKIKYAVLSNSMFDDARLDSLVDAGIMGYVASVDGIDDIKSIDKQADEKSRKGFEKLLKFKKKGVKILGANFAMSRKNFEETPAVAKALTDYGFFVNVSPIVYGKGNWEFRVDIPDEFKFKSEDAPKIDAVMNELLQMKKEGRKIAVPDAYLKDMSKYCINLNWKCGANLKNPAQIRVDAAGGLMVCNDIRGKIAEEYNVTSLDEKTYKKFMKDWRESEERQKCPGCYWSALVKAEQDLLAGRREFEYMK